MHISLSLIGAFLLAQAYAQGCPAVRPVTTVITVSALPSSTPSVESVAQTTTSVEDSEESTTYVPTTSTEAAGTSTTSLPEASEISTDSLSTFLSSETSVSNTLSSPPTTLLTSTRVATSDGLTSESLSSVFETPASSTERPAESTSEATSTTTSISSSKLSTSSTAAPTSTSIARTYPADVVDQLRDSSITKLASYLKQNPASNGCTLETASIRREWTDLSVAQREEYIAAVRCLQSAPSKSSATEIPGARSRFDDFVAVHIQQTDSIHNTANFLSWHRYFVFTYEKALREECGYTGYHPYWNWDRYASDPASSPLFNGNASSLSGNSVNGGCVTTGPFANLQVNLGPGKSLTYNPRCMTRAISKSYAATTTADKTYSLITGSSSISSFQNTLQAVPGVHSGGHFTIGGTPGGDIYASPGDPAFYLHHAMVDRVWWIWQMQDLATRLTAVAGSVAGSSRQGSASDTVALGVNAGSVTISELLNTLGGLDGEFCYIYV